MTKIDVMSKIKEGIAQAETQKQEVITGLGSDQPENISSIREALAKIQMQFQQDDIPYNTIEIGLNHVMSLLKKYEELAVELEPEDISQIVQGYMALTDQEVRTIFDKSSKKKTTKKPTTAVDRILKAASEKNNDLSDTNFDDLVF